ncbi:MAG: hypothetical protein KatS3mg002_1369 [Candidatus Woesearchaeota archaeon]|nr:MAG: hypothetical protein KatS3mg002_1369 [Candidatus Woesearchaeota archaeon]
MGGKLKYTNNGIERISSTNRKFFYPYKTIQNNKESPVNFTGYLKGSSTVSNPYNLIPSHTITTTNMAGPILANGQLLLPNTGDYYFEKIPVVEKRLFQKGGTIDTLFVSNPKDSRLKAYKDSLMLYNASKEYEGKLPVISVEAVRYIMRPGQPNSEYYYNKVATLPNNDPIGYYVEKPTPYITNYYPKHAKPKQPVVYKPNHLELQKLSTLPSNPIFNPPNPQPKSIIPPRTSINWETEKSNRKYYTKSFDPKSEIEKLWNPVIKRTNELRLKHPPAITKKCDSRYKYNDCPVFKEERIKKFKNKYQSGGYQWSTEDPENYRQPLIIPDAVVIPTDVLKPSIKDYSITQDYPITHNEYPPIQHPGYIKQLPKGSLLKKFLFAPLATSLGVKEGNIPDMFLSLPAHTGAAAIETAKNISHPIRTIKTLGKAGINFITDLSGEQNPYPGSTSKALDIILDALGTVPLSPGRQLTSKLIELPKNELRELAYTIGTQSEHPYRSTEQIIRGIKDYKDNIKRRLHNEPPEYYDLNYTGDYSGRVDLLKAYLKQDYTGLTPSNLPLSTYQELIQGKTPYMKFKLPLYDDSPANLLELEIRTPSKDLNIFQQLKTIEEEIKKKGRFEAGVDVGLLPPETKAYLSNYRAPTSFNIAGHEILIIPGGKLGHKLIFTDHWGFINEVKRPGFPKGNYIRKWRVNSNDIGKPIVPAFLQPKLMGMIGKPFILQNEIDLALPKTVAGKKRLAQDIGGLSMLRRIDKRIYDSKKSMVPEKVLGETEMDVLNLMDQLRDKISKTHYNFKHGGKYTRISPKKNKKI